MLYILMTKGLKQSVCDQSFYIGPVSKFWAYAFVLSKAPELGEYPLSFSHMHLCIFREEMSMQTAQEGSHHCQNPI